MAAETGKPGTNWKQVTPANRKKVSPLVKHWMKQAHPFTACFNELKGEKGEEAAKRICAVVKDMGERSTKWRKGGGGKKVREAVDEIDFDALVEDHFDEVIAPVLDAEGVTVEEIARWSELAVAGGVLEAVTFDDPEELVRVSEAAKPAPMARGHRRPGESLADFGNRMKRADKAKAAAAAPKTRSGKTAGQQGAQGGDFNTKHPRGRGGEWTVKVGGKDVAVKEHPDGNLRATSDTSAVRRFQRAHGLKVDGIIGKQTASALLGNKSAHKVTAGKLKDDQRAKLLKAKAKKPRQGRVRETPELDDALEALAGVSFKPSELVEACR